MVLLKVSKTLIDRLHKAPETWNLRHRCKARQCRCELPQAMKYVRIRRAGTSGRRELGPPVAASGRRRARAWAEAREPGPPVAASGRRRARAWAEATLSRRTLALAVSRWLVRRSSSSTIILKTNHFQRRHALPTRPGLPTIFSVLRNGFRHPKQRG